MRAPRSSSRSAPALRLRHLATSWALATVLFAALGAALAAIALARAQYPLLSPAQAGALVATWASTAAVPGALLGAVVAVAAALAPGRWPRLCVALAVATLAALLVVTRGSDAPPLHPVGSAPPTATPSTPPPTAPANLVLVTIDTLRADHLDAYGYARATAPVLRELAAGGVLFESAIAAAPATQLSLASLLTGLQPWSHADVAFARPPGAPYLRSGFATIAERLASAGYTTA